VQEAAEDQVHPAFAVSGDPFGDLLGRADQLGAEAVVVLHQVLERRVGPPVASSSASEKLVDSC
jgi:hypothetical protein